MAWQAYRMVYNVFFHPLRQFPGPLHRRASALPWAFSVFTGKNAFAVQKLHDKYGPVVRIAPEHLSFTDPAAWKDIYGHMVGHKSGMQEMNKTRAFNKTLDDDALNVLNSDREEHGRLRRALSRMSSP